MIEIEIDPLSVTHRTIAETTVEGLTVAAAVVVLIEAVIEAAEETGAAKDGLLLMIG
jgi:hypothetical protein